jgi:hypothetical protein
MLSTDLEGYGFSTWIKIVEDYDYNRDLILKLPRKKGVYVIRADRPISRIKGKSDIIYIGQGKIQSRIQHLLRSYLPINFRDYFSKHTARKGFEKILKETELKLEFSYITVDSEKAKEIERRLLVLYCEEHIEPPPLNNTRR